jgi:lipopolysaccharide biosynthesis regulator YciM
VKALPQNAPAPPPAVKRLTPAEKAAATIEQHQKRFDASADPVEKAAMLNSMANLYAMRLGDTPKAIELYERLVFEFPQYPGLRGVYPKLAESYAAVGREEERRKTYQAMMKAFTPDTQEHQFAALELGLK